MRGMRKFSLALVAIAVLAVGFMADGVRGQSVQQSGNVTPRHVMCWTTNGVAQDCGTSTAGYPSTFGLSQQGGTPFCITNLSQPPPYPVGAQYSQFCLGISTAGAYLTLNSYNGAPSLPMSLIINGVPYNFPSNVPTPIRIVASGTTDSVVPTDANGTIAWNSSTALAKAESIFACTSLNAGFQVTVLDEKGTANTYPIVITPTSGTINNTSSFSLTQGNQAITLQCDGVSNWVVRPVLPSVAGLRQISTGSTDTASSSDVNGVIAWNSSTASAKTETLFTCNSGSIGNRLTIVDEKQTAGTYPITVTPAGGNTIMGTSVDIIAFNGEPQTYVCDGVSNWMRM